MRPDLTQTVLSKIDDAVADHMEWLQRWHRAVICGLPPDREVVSENAHFLCRFGGWYEINRECGLVDQPAIHSLDEAHREMHDCGRRLALNVADGHPVSPADYDLLVGKVDAFNDRARRICTAFRTALSDLDPLTGVYNRQAMLDVIERERERLVRTGTPCSIAIADLDYFKRINDSHGHVAGDQVLYAAASLCLSKLRPYDTVFRYGGEEFLICLPDTPEAAAQRVLERLRLGLEETPIELDSGERLSLTASFGLAEINGDVSLREIIERADMALYDAKRAGRNRIVAWHPGNDAAGREAQSAHG